MIYQDWFPAISELIAATDEGNILTTDLYDRPPIQPWSQQNITLLGDAAHPMLPTMGQGACTALEDAYVVAQCLQAQPDPSVLSNSMSLCVSRAQRRSPLHLCNPARWAN
jgi:2-polyprenyl-6-methoxyphenol hydroxylase-like FAD-dependent oxidoreductase